MLLLTGTFIHNVDEKLRLSIPALHRSQLKEAGEPKRLYLLPMQHYKTLWLYPQKRFESLSDQIESELAPDEDSVAFAQAVFPEVEILEIDSSGRVQLQAQTLKDVGIEREVVVWGVRDHLELMTRETCEALKAERKRNFGEYMRRASNSHQRKRRQPGQGPENSFAT